MSYMLGEEADWTWDVEVNDVDTEPTTFVVVITKPDGTVEGFTPANPSPGKYTGTYKFPVAGHYRVDVLADGAVVAAQTQVADVWDPASQVQPLTGLVGLWSDAASLARRPEIAAYNAAQAADTPPGEPISQQILNDALRFASEILYVLSGRQFAGINRTYCRPVARPEGWDVRSWGASASFSYWSSWGSSYSMGYGAATGPAVGYHLGQNYPHELALNYPVQRVEQVKIDGTVIPADEYRVDDYRLLTRVRPSAAFSPTARGDWPHWQALWLPDTEPGTFSVTYWYGAPPPQSGITAVEAFAVELALDMVGADSRLPARIREISRQGETVAVIDSLETLQRGWTGIPLCDYFIASLNPGRLVRRGAVWTPDMGRSRTPTS